MPNVNFRIYTEIDRLPASDIERFHDMPVAFLGDHMNRIACMDSAIKPYGRTRLCGSAFTVKAAIGDNLLLHKALDMARPGDVIVVDGRGNTDHALCGDNMMTYAKRRGIEGFVIDGAIRDAESIARMDYPVYARGVSPNGPFKNGPGEINVPINCGGQVVCPGDIILADADGIIVIPAKDADWMYEKGLEQTRVEEQVMKDILSDTLDRSWIDKALSDKGCEIL